MKYVVGSILCIVVVCGLVIWLALNPDPSSCAGGNPIACLQTISAGRR